MNFMILTHGLTLHNTRLMPWRYVMEVARGIINAGHIASVVSDGPRDVDRFPSGFPQVRMVNGPFSIENPLYRHSLEEARPDVIYFPVSRRAALFGNIPASKGVAHIAYFPSAWYDPWITLKVCRELPFLDALRFILESAIPAKWLVNALKSKGCLAVATVTDYTASQFLRGGWPSSQISVFPPGIDSIAGPCMRSEIFKEIIPKLSTGDYILYMGPSRAIRGIYVLLKAFDMAATAHDDISLVCLIRKDGSVHDEELSVAIGKMKNRDRVIVVNDRLDSVDVSAFIQGCHAVVLPFLLVPAEIPLAVIEALSFSKPVLMSETGGTSQFVGKAGIIIQPNNVAALTRGIIDICTDNNRYVAMCVEAKSILESLPNWKRLAKDYIEFTQKIIEVA